MLTVSNKKLDVYQVFDKVKSSKARKDKIQVLRENDTMAVLDVLRGTFDSTIQWNLPEGEVPFTPAEEEAPPSSLLKQHLKFKYFVKGLRESNNLRSVKRERMFIDMCESVHPRDAEVIVAMINKKSPVKGITKKLVQEAFPHLIIE
tara:strand:+ start:1165 stop:1605 length:441 start_codon:yes stop_codon:yes gene_type:complete